MTEQQKVFKLGYSSILAPDEEFAHGYSEGYLAYPEEEHPLTVEALRKIIVEALVDTTESAAWNIGYIAGAIRGIYEGHPSLWNTGPQAPSVQFGNATLHLNRWSFRCGYEIGQADYRANLAERPSPRALTANELLRYLAHHDRKTNQYSLGEEELFCLEDTLGRLTGYLCAALFPKPSQEHDPELVNRRRSGREM